jgi:hypothetical protein
MKAKTFNWAITGFFFLGIFIFYPEIKSSYFFLIGDSEDANPETISLGYPKSFLFQILTLTIWLFSLLVFFLILLNNWLGLYLGIGFFTFCLMLSILVESRLFTKPISIYPESKLFEIGYFLVMVLILMIKKNRSSTI